MVGKIISTLLPYMPRKLVWAVSKKYIAGESIEDAICVAKKLNNEGILTTIDILGEFITKLDEAEANKQEYLEVIEAAERAGVQGNYSLKPTSFGLLLDKEVCYNHIREIVVKAASYKNFVRLDMEDSSCTDLEIELFRRLKKEYPENIGLAIQSYLKRSNSDIKKLKDLHNGQIPLNLRLCKGIYVEPESISYKDYDEINSHFLEDIELMLKEKMYPAIATHDLPIIEGSYELIRKYGVSQGEYEFQMLYGVTPVLRNLIVENGHTMRVYVPFGKEWFGYCSRRLKENPKLVRFILKAFFSTS